MENSSVKNPEQLHSLVKVTILKTNYKNYILLLLDLKQTFYFFNYFIVTLLHGVVNSTDFLPMVNK